VKGWFKKTFQSILKKYEWARQTKLGPEEITREIPNVGRRDASEAWMNLDYQSGSLGGVSDILVGKVPQKGNRTNRRKKSCCGRFFGKARDGK